MLITKAINKDGIENFDIEILIDNVEKDVDENFYIERENTRAPHGYNERRGEGSGSVYYDEKHKKYRVNGPGPDYTFVGLYFKKETGDKALEWFNRTGERMESDRIKRKKGTGTFHITKNGRYRAIITVKGKRYDKTFDTEDECEAFFIRTKEKYS